MREDLRCGRDQGYPMSNWLSNRPVPRRMAHPLDEEEDDDERSDYDTGTTTVPVYARHRSYSRR